MAGPGGGSKAGVIGCGGSKLVCQLTLSRRARASAQLWRKKIFRRGRATVQAAINFSLWLMNIRVSVFAAWPADWRYVACWTARRVIERGVDGFSASA